MHGCNLIVRLLVALTQSSNMHTRMHVISEYRTRKNAAVGCLPSRPKTGEHLAGRKPGSPPQDLRFRVFQGWSLGGRWGVDPTITGGMGLVQGAGMHSLSPINLYLAPPPCSPPLIPSPSLPSGRRRTLRQRCCSARSTTARPLTCGRAESPSTSCYAGPTPLRMRQTLATSERRYRSATCDPTGAVGYLCTT